MINITEKEFINYLERYANKEISMNQLVKDLETDTRTLNNKIIEISIVNPDLYYKIVTSHPYKQKARADIDFEALMIYILKQEITIGQAVDIFNVSRRTIQRRMNEVNETNPKLYKLFKKAIGRDTKRTRTIELQDEIDKLQYKKVVVGEINEERENFLLDIERNYNDLIATGMTKDQAAKEMGYTSSYMYKLLNELYRLKIEKNVKEDNKQKSFREGLSDMTQYTNEEITGQILNKSNETKNNEAR